MTCASWPAGIHPALLEDEGLPAAVAALARRAGAAGRDPDRVSIGGCRGSVEATAYFTVAEALTNATRHARAKRAMVTIVDEGSATDGRRSRMTASVARIRVRGTGLRGLADRLASVDGRLDGRQPGRRRHPAPGGGAVP